MKKLLATLALCLATFGFADLALAQDAASAPAAATTT
jgi:hypothetical protein